MTFQTIKWSVWRLSAVFMLVWMLFGISVIAEIREIEDPSIYRYLGNDVSEGQSGMQANRWLVQAKTAMAEQDWKEAISILNEVIDNAPDQLRARRLRAMCYREKAKILFNNSARSLYFLRPDDLLKTRREARIFAVDQTGGFDPIMAYDVTRAIYDFEHILFHDSLFLDVVHQYAILWRDHQVLKEAIDLEEVQLHYKPEHTEAHVELVNTYRQYIDWTESDDALRWLRKRATPYSVYFAGEVIRKKGNLDQADAIFERILAEPMVIPRQPVLLSRARIYITRGQDEDGYRFINEALQIVDLAGARLLFEDFCHIFTPEEYEVYLQLTTIEDFDLFYSKMWERRDPMPGAWINARVVEHYRRLIKAERDYVFWGERTWFNNPDTAKELVIPSVASLSRGFNDKGLIYIRHGEPDKRIVSVRAQHPNESWRYREQGMDFHFMVAEDGIGNNWRLTPVIDDCYAAVDRSEWGGIYLQMSPPIQLDDPCAADEAWSFRQDFVNGRISMAYDSRENVTEGLTTDRHTWEDDVQILDLPSLLTAFRGVDGNTHLYIHYVVPVGEFSYVLGEGTQTLNVEVGVALHDTILQQMDSHAEVIHFPSSTDRTAAAINLFQISVPPDSYRVAVHVRSLQANILGSIKLEYRVPDFSDPGLNISDLLPAYRVAETDLEGGFIKRGFYIEANPFGIFSKRLSMYVYFELYNLNTGDDGQSRYEITYTLAAAKQRRRLLGIAGRDRFVLSLMSQEMAMDPSPSQYAEIDVSRIPEGEYILTVTIEDKLTGQTVERTQNIELVQ